MVGVVVGASILAALCFVASPISVKIAHAAATDAWHWQNPRDPANTLFGVACPDTTSCVAGGADGLVYVTVNGGAIWSPDSTGTTQTWDAVACPTSAFCLAVGSEGGSAHTTSELANWLWSPLSQKALYGMGCDTTPRRCFAVGEGGQIWVYDMWSTLWTPRTSPTTKTLFGATCIDDSICIVVGDNGTILRTTNGGATWSVRPSVTTENLHDVGCIDTFCIATGDGDSSPTSGDSGATWQLNGVSQRGAALYGISCPSTITRQCFAGGTDGSIYVATYPWSAWVPSGTPAAGAIWSVSCPSATLCIGVGDYATIVRSTTAGTGWKHVSPDTRQSVINSMSCPDTQTCFATSQNGLLVSTTDGGDSWSTNSTLEFSGSISCPTALACYLTGIVAGEGVVLATVDGGAHWAQQDLGSTSTFSAISCPTATVCFGVGGQGKVVVTTDGGAHWNPQSSGTTETFTSISCPSTAVCYAAGVAPAGGYGIVGTTDGGANWNTLIATASGGPLWGISCGSATTCTAVGNAMLIATSNSGTTWNDQKPSGLSDNIFSVSCPTTTSCSAVSGGGTILATSNGTSWSVQATTSFTLLSVSCPSASVCFAGAQTGYVVRTVNGGAAWLQDGPFGVQSDSLTGADCPTPSTCYAAGSSRTTPVFGQLSAMVFKTTNGGANWHHVLEFSGLTIAGFSCANATVCAALAYTSFSGFPPPPLPVNGTYLLITADGGDNWAWKLIAGPVDYPKSLSCPTATTCFAAFGSGNVTSTTDGGDHWSTPVNATALGLSSISCPSTTTCYATDYAPAGEVLRTTNGGANWGVAFNLKSDPSAGTMGVLGSIDCPTTIACYAAGKKGVIATTTDGLHWRTDNSPTKIDLDAVGCFSADVCEISVEDGSILRTEDGGGFWEPQYPDTGAWMFNGVACGSATACVAVGPQGTITRTTSGGQAWTMPEPTGNTGFITSLSCFDSSNCYGAGSQVLRSTHNGGATWNVHVVTTTDQMVGISCPAAGTCFAVGWPGAIYKTIDGGTTWNYQSSPVSGVDVTLDSVSCWSTTSCVAVGSAGTILMTNDGSTWNPESSATKYILSGVSCPNAQVCVAVGERGVIRTRTGGSWHLAASGVVVPLTSIACPTGTTCYATGASGAIISTTNQGVNWSLMSSGTSSFLGGITCASASLCLAVGRFGELHMLAMGRWWLGNTPTQNLLASVAFPDVDHAWIAGAGGTILFNPAPVASVFPAGGCTSASLAPPAPVQEVATTVNLTASSGGCTSPQYEYWVRMLDGKWYLQRPWGAAAWAWSTAGLRPGTYTVRVWANEAGHATASYESAADSVVKLTGCTSAAISPPSSSVVAGGSKAFTATSAGCSLPRYEFWLQNSAGTWRLMRGWGSASWTWSTAGWAKGTYHVRAWANQQGADTHTYEVFGAATVKVT